MGLIRGRIHIGVDMDIHMRVPDDKAEPTLTQLKDRLHQNFKDDFKELLSKEVAPPDDVAINISEYTVNNVRIEG